MINKTVPEMSPEDRFVEFLKEFINESDRAAVVLGAARIDILLKQLIEKGLLPRIKEQQDELLDGPLWPFGARVMMAYRLGLIDDELRRATDLIRKIRNPFAHSPDQHLDNESHCDRVRTLCIPYQELKIFSEGVAILKQKNPEMTTISAMFRVALALIAVRLERAIDEMQQIVPSRTFRLTSEHWLVQKDK